MKKISVKEIMLVKAEINLHSLHKNTVNNYVLLLLIDIIILKKYSISILCYFQQEQA